MTCVQHYRDSPKEGRRTHQVSTRTLILVERFFRLLENMAQERKSRLRLQRRIHPVGGVAWKFYPTSNFRIRARKPEPGTNTGDKIAPTSPDGVHQTLVDNSKQFQQYIFYLYILVIVVISNCTYLS